MHQPIWTPDALYELLVESLPSVEVRLLEFRMGTEWQPTLVNEAQETRIALVRFLVQAACQQVLLQVVFALLGVGQIAVARVEALGQQQQAADTVTILRECACSRLVSRRPELLCVSFWMVGPDVLDLVAMRPATPRVLGVARCLSR